MTFDSTFEATLAFGRRTTTVRTGTPGPPSVGTPAARKGITREGVQVFQTRMNTIPRRMVAEREPGLKIVRVLPVRRGTLLTSALKIPSDILEHSKHLSCASQPLLIRHRSAGWMNSAIKKSNISESSAGSEGTIGEKLMDPDRWAPLPVPPSCISLLSGVLRDLHQQSLICNLSGSDAQLMADYLDIVSRETNVLQSDERRRARYLLYKLATSVPVFPRCYELSDINIDMDIEPMGGGGFSDVYRGKQGDQSICLKIIRVCYKQDSGCTLKTAGRELALWAHLSHPHILPLYGIYLLGTTRPRLCFVSPWMENGNLRNYLEKFPQKPRMPLISDITDGLVYLHNLGIVHSDLKAENILVSDDGHALIADFGVSSIAASTQLMSVTPHGGTTRWMAPELLLREKGEVRATKTCDIWSFACLCYEVFTHKIPFYQYYGDPQVLLALMRKEVPLRQDPGIGYEEIDERVWELLMKCWDYSPQDRPSCETVRDVIKDMRFQDDRPKVVAKVNFPACPYTRRWPHAEIDYARLREILARINNSVISPPLTRMGSSGVI